MNIDTKHALCILVLVCVGCSAPDATSPPGPKPLDTLWAVSAGGAKADSCRGVSVDGAGNSYVTGRFAGVASFGSQKPTSSWHGFDIFAGKLTPNGRFAWVAGAGSSKTDWAKGIATNDGGDSFITGSFEHTGTFGSLTVLASGLRVDAFAAKLDTNGKFIWATPIGGLEEDTGNGIALGPKGGVYVTGLFRHEITLGNKTYKTRGEDDVMVVKLDKDGKIVWGAVGGGVLRDWSHSITVDEQGNSYITGAFIRKAQLGAFSLKGADDDSTRRAFVAKLTPSGSFAWARALGGDDSSVGNAITTFDGGACVTGSFGGKATFGSHQATAIGGSDIFVAKLDSKGAFAWARHFGGGHASRGEGTAADERHCVVSGEFDGSGVDFGNAHALSANGGDAFVVVLDADGKTVDAESGGGPKMDHGFGVALGSDAIHVCGSHLMTAGFGPTSLTSAGDQDAFFWKLQGVVKP